MERGDGLVGDAGTAESRPPYPPRPRPLRVLLHAVCGLVGLAAVLGLVHHVGPAELVGMLRALARWMPLLLAIEGVRIASEALVTASLSPQVRRGFAPLALGRIHLVGFAVSVVMPAGRAAGEAAKAAMLSPRIGAARAAAIATTSQSIALLGGTITGVACALAAFRVTGASALTAAIGIYACVTLGAFVVLQLACRRRELLGLLGRRFTRAEKPAAAFRAALGEIPVLPVGATLLSLLGRALQVLQLGVLLHAVGAANGPLHMLLAQGVSLVGGGAGDFIPGQLGATDGAFALAAPLLGIAAADAVAVTVMVHVIQLCWALIGASAPIWWRVKPRLGDAERA